MCFPQAKGLSKYDTSCSTGIENQCMVVFDTNENAEKAAEILNKEMEETK